LTFIFISFIGAAIAGFFGAMLVKHAPIEGGRSMHVMQGE
jgi:hypothetical protein